MTSVSVTFRKAVLGVQFLAGLFAWQAGAAGGKSGARGEALAFAERKCLTEGIYFEAASEGEAGMRAVAEVVFRRQRTRGYPDTVCKVIYQGAPGTGCQFSFACDGARVRPRSKWAWQAAWRLAGDLLDDPEAALAADVTQGALRFHTVDVDPDWESEGFEETVTIGRHIFFRPAR